MRGIDGALSVLAEVEQGAFVSEALRKKWDSIEPAERKLAASLAYATLRRQGLWKHLLAKYCKRPVESLSPQIISILTVGIAGLMTLEHFAPAVLVNAMVQKAKKIRQKDAPQDDSSLVNAVLRTVMRGGAAYIASLEKSTALRDQALAAGVPGWVAAEWNADYGMKEAKRLVTLSTGQTYMSLRVAPGVARSNWIDEYNAKGSPEQEGELPAEPSDFLASSVRLRSNPYPLELPGYDEGQITPQGEASIWAVESLVPHLKDNLVLDMCMGRGIKSGHLLSLLPDLEVEGWDISQGRLRSAEREFRRLGVSARARTTVGDALNLSPAQKISAILLDAPCTGSGTWGRHPEGKWRMTPAKLKKASELQEKLFSKAADILSPGGIIMYCTCSIFRAENEKVVGSVLSSRSDLVELPVRSQSGPAFRGKPYGYLMFPDTPWTDGFYVAIFKKKS